MATTTPLGFQKPSGGDAIRDGDNAIAANAQRAEDLIAGAQAAANSLAGRVNNAETSISSTTARVTAVESVNAGQDVRLATVESAAFVGGGLLIEDPADPGFYLVGAP